MAQRKISALGDWVFENAPAPVMPRKRAEALGIHSIADLAHAATSGMTCRDDGSPSGDLRGRCAKATHAGGSKAAELLLP